MRIGSFDYDEVWRSELVSRSTSRSVIGLGIMSLGTVASHKQIEAAHTLFSYYS